MKRIIGIFVILTLVFAMCPQLHIANAYAANDAERSFSSEHYFQTLGDGGELYECYSYGSNEAVVYSITGVSKEEYTIQKTIKDGVSGINRTIVGIISVAELNYDDNYDEKPFRFGSNNEYLRITKLTFPDSIRFIGSGAFYGFKDLKGVTFKSKGLTVEDQAFRNCTSLESISFPEGSDVASTALQGCSGLKSIENAPSLVDLGEYYPELGDKEPQLQKISFMKGITEVERVYVDISQGEGKESKSVISTLTTVVLPEGVKRIADCAFEGYTGLTSMNFPSSLEEIGYGAFDGCASLKGSVDLNSVKEVGTHAFMGCKNLNISVTHPGDYTDQQYRSSGVTTITFSKDAENIWPSGLYDCKSLNNITVQSGNANYKSENGVLFTKEDGYWKLVKYPAAKSGSSYTVPSWVEELGSYAFDSCSLSEIHLPANIYFEERYAEEFLGDTEEMITAFDNMKSKPVVYVEKDSNTDLNIDHSGSKFTVKYEAGTTTPGESTPSTPGTPSEPSAPSTPSTPSTPSEPSAPSTPSTPSTPSEPSTPREPSVEDDDAGMTEEETLEMLALTDYFMTDDDTEWTKGGCKYIVLTNFKYDPEKYKVDKDKNEAHYKESAPGTVALIKAKNTKSVKIPATVKLNKHTFKVVQINANAFKGKKIRTVTLGKNVKVIKKNAFKNSKATKVILKTKLLKKSKVKNCLKGSKVKTVQIKVGNKSLNKKYVKKYKKYFTKKNAGIKVTIK